MHLLMSQHAVHVLLANAGKAEHCPVATPAVHSYGSLFEQRARSRSHTTFEQGLSHDTVAGGGHMVMSQHALQKELGIS